MAELDGIYVVNLDQAHRRLERVLDEADVLVINGVCSADLLPIMQQRRQRGRVTLFEINDDVQQMQSSNPLAAFFAQPHNVRLFRRLALSADAVQYSAPELERLYGRLNARGRVFPNQLRTIPPPRTPTSPRPVTIGWGGSLGHADDVAEVAPALCRFVLENPMVTLHLMCADRIWQLFEALPAERKRRTAVGSIEDYYAFVSQLDIGIAPNRNEGFNRARSDVKFLEYAAYGAVPLVQRLTPYLESVREGETGLFFESPEDLIRLLDRLVRDPDECRRIRENAYRYASTERRQGAHAAARVAFYEELGAGRGTSDVAALFAELSQLEGAECRGRHCVLTPTRFESLLHDGLLLLQQSAQEQRGAALLREAAALEPQQAQPELSLGLQRRSETDLLAALAKNPRSVQALLALGRLLLDRAQFRGALERFLQAAELAPGYEMPFAHAAQAVAKLGGAKEAAEFERIARSLAEAVTLPAQAEASARAPAAERSAWQLLEQGGHLQTLNPDYAPTGLLEMIASAPRRVLDVGCFCGGTGRWLKQRFPGCEVVGIELLEQAAAKAGEVYDRVLVGSFEQLDFAALGVLEGSFDVIVTADVLEHLYNPWQALLRLRPLLAPGGALYVSLPNVRNLKLLTELARGNFEYEGAGILDVTHVRFFTRATAVRMLEQTGFTVRDVRINPDARLAALFDGKDLNHATSIELDGLSLSGLSREDLLELAALQLYFRATPD